MSRIHEALKQASANPDLRSPAPPLPPPPRAEGVFVQMPEAKQTPMPLLLGLAAVVLLLAGVGVGLLWSGGEPDRVTLAGVTRPAENPSGRAAENAPLQNAAPAPQVEGTEATEKTETAAVPDVTPAAAQPEPAPAPDAPAAPAAETVSAEPVKPAAPAYRLQGIAFHPTAPSALINGRRVGLGEEVSGARVTRIEQSAVTLAVNGRNEVLRLR